MNEFPISSREELAITVKKQLGGKSYIKLNSTGSIHVVPGENIEVG